VLLYVILQSVDVGILENRIDPMTIIGDDYCQLN
jgi:hypothetical protein